MSDALIFLLRSLGELYISAFLLRLVLQWLRADFYNPLSQFIIRVTNPLVVPLRRVVPAVGRIDTASLVAALGLQLAVTLLLLNLACIGEPGLLQVLGLAALRLVYLLLRIYFFALLIYVVMSWIAPGGYNPATSLLASLCEPVLAPFRRLIPPIGGIDLSPLFAILLLQALTMLLPAGPLLRGLLCSAMGQPL